MTGITLVLDGDGHLAGKDPIVCEEMPTILCLAGGMQSGAPSIAIVLTLPDGRVTFCQTSARAFVAAARAITGRWPELRDTAGPLAEDLP